jgi:hypothetical protein
MIAPHLEEMSKTLEDVVFLKVIPALTGTLEPYLDLPAKKSNFFCKIFL